MTAPHPTERRLAAFIDGRLDGVEASAVGSHVGSCEFCRHRLAYCDAPALDPDSALPTAAPEAVFPAEAEWEERDSDPSVGDVWRVMWEGLVELAFVRSFDVQDARLGVLPVIEHDSADNWCLLTGIVAVGTSVPVAVSAAHESWIPWCVLDARVGRLPEPALAQLDALRSAFRSGQTAPDGVAVGEPIMTRLDERAEAIDAVADRFQVLANVEYLPASQEQAAASEPLPGYDELEAAGLPPQRILAIRRGDAPTTEEAEAVEAATGWRLAATAPVIPLERRREVDRPRWRARIRRTAARQGLSEAEERIRLFADMDQPMAARGTGGRPVPLDVLLDQLLDE